LLWFIAGTPTSAQTAPGLGYDRAALTEAICRQYAAAQRTMPYDTMYAQCMYARGYRVPGFSSTPQAGDRQAPDTMRAILEDLEAV